MNKALRPILVAEDEESDRLILQLAFKRAQLPNPLVLVSDGQEAVEYLSEKGRSPDHNVDPLPALLVLDLKMPRMDGFGLLAWVARQPEFKHIPAVVLSSSSDEVDMSKARELGARAYFVKPHRVAELIKIAQQMQARWLNGGATDGRG
jgi:CheY-like chemotaxis protein